MTKARATKKEREMAALKQRMRDLAYGVIGCDWFSEKEWLAADQLHELVCAIRHGLLDGEIPESLTYQFESITTAGQWAKPDELLERFYDAGVRA